MRWIFGLALMAVLLGSLMAQPLLRYEQTTLVKLAGGQTLDNDDLEIIDNAIYQRIPPGGVPIPEILRVFVANYQIRMYVESSSYKPGPAQTGQYLGCLVTDSTTVQRFWPVDYERGDSSNADYRCKDSTLSMHVTPQGAGALSVALAGGQDPARAILHVYQNGIYLTSNDNGTNLKLFFAGIAGWFAGWFI